MRHPAASIDWRGVFGICESRRKGVTSRLDGHIWQVLTDAIVAGGHTSPVGLPTVWNVDDNRMASGGIKHVPLICECAKDLRSGEPLDNHHRTRTLWTRPVALGSRFFDIRSFRRNGFADQFPAERKGCCAPAIGEKAVMPDANESWRKYM